LRGAAERVGVAREAQRRAVHDKMVHFDDKNVAFAHGV
jgi:hypothetical protein